MGFALGALTQIFLLPSPKLKFEEQTVFTNQ